MPFQPGNQEAKKRKSVKGGRPSDDTQERLKAALDAACPEPDRKEIFQGLREKARDGDVNAARTLLAYMYGTPRSGDEMKIEEEVEKAIDSTLTRIEKSVSPEAWREVETALGI